MRCKRIGPLFGPLDTRESSRRTVCALVEYRKVLSDGDTRGVTRSSVGLVLGCLVWFGCRTIPGQDVRYDPTPMPVVRALLELADVGLQDLVYDLGSGDGRIPITAAKEFGARGVGIEIDPDLVTQAQMNAREAGVEDRVEFRLGNMYTADVRPATVVTLFLNPGPNLKLRDKLRSDLQAGSRIVSYVWDMGAWTPTEVRRVNEHKIFLWQIPVRPPHGPGIPKPGTLR